MKKEMNILEDKKQVRVSIPKKLVKKFDVNKEDKFKWKDQKGKLKGELIKK